MKKYNIFTLLVMLFTASVMTSCLKDQEDLFDESASKRLTSYMNNVQDILVGAEYGWALDYYPDRNQSYGGYNYTLKFDRENVEARFDLSKKLSLTEPVVSTYKFVNESGPCLLFDTYNVALHHFATPTGSSGPGGYQAYDGDFMLLILGVSDDQNTITLKGTRSGNVMYMHRLTNDPAEYMEQATAKMGKMVFPNYRSADSTVYATVDEKNRQFEVTNFATGETFESPFIFTQNGGNFHTPGVFMGKEISSFSYNEADSTLTVDGINISLKVVIPGIAEKLIGGSMVWYLSYDNLSPIIQPFWKTAATNLHNDVGEDLNTMAIIGDAVYIKSATYPMYFELLYEVQAENAAQDSAIVYFNITRPHPTLDEYDNAPWYLENCPNFANFLIQFLDLSYLVTYVDEDQTQIKLEYIKNPAVSFTVSLDAVAPYQFSKL
jgi:hypothetical protein